MLAGEPVEPVAAVSGPRGGRQARPRHIAFTTCFWSPLDDLIVTSQAPEEEAGEAWCRVKLWDSVTGALRFTLSDHTEQVVLLARLARPALWCSDVVTAGPLVLLGV